MARAERADAVTDSGLYLAPLRLLALEGQEELEKRGKVTSFVTGEERDLRPDARFTSSTIEMLGFETKVDAVVIDEVQLLADERRGWAWLAALLGAPAETVSIARLRRPRQGPGRLPRRRADDPRVQALQRVEDRHGSAARARAHPARDQPADRLFADARLAVAAPVDDAARRRRRSGLTDRAPRAPAEPRRRPRRLRSLRRQKVGSGRIALRRRG